MTLVYRGWQTPDGEVMSDGTPFNEGTLIRGERRLAIEQAALAAIDADNSESGVYIWNDPSGWRVTIKIEKSDYIQC